MIKITHPSPNINQKMFANLLIGALCKVPDGNLVYMKVSSPHSLVGLTEMWPAVCLDSGQMQWIRLEQYVIELNGELAVREEHNDS